MFRVSNIYKSRVSIGEVFEFKPPRLNWFYGLISNNRLPVNVDARISALCRHMRKRSLLCSSQFWPYTSPGEWYVELPPVIKNKSISKSFIDPYPYNYTTFDLETMSGFRSTLISVCIYWLSKGRSNNSPCFWSMQLPPVSIANCISTHFSREPAVSGYKRLWIACWD